VLSRQAAGSDVAASGVRLGGLMPEPIRTARAVSEALSQAKTALDLGRAPEAEKLARAVLDADDRHTEARKILGGALLLQGRFEDAIEPLEAVVQISRDPSLDTQLAIALRETGRNEAALSRLKRAIKRKPPYMVAFHELGYLLHKMKRHDEAIAAIEQGLQIAPLSGSLFVLLGGIHHARRQMPRAKAAYARALTISPDLSSAHYGLGSVLMDEAAYAQAISHFRAALMGDPSDVQARLRFAACLLEAGDTDAALGLLRTAVRGDPQVYGTSLKVALSVSKGRFWLRPSTAARALT